MTGNDARRAGDQPEPANNDARRAGDHSEVTSERERLADQDRDPAGADRDPAGADHEPAGAEHPAGANRDPAGAVRVTPLERHTRLLLRAYPAAYRRERGGEIIGTLLEASDDRTWPRVRDARALTFGGLKARAAQNRQRTAGANLRVAVMAGLAIYTAIWFATYAAGVIQGFVWFGPGSPPPIGWMGWPAAVTALLAGATVVLAWIAPRVGLLAGALAAAAVVGFAVASHDALPQHLIQALGVAGLAALAPRAGHPSWRWLWLPGLIVLSGLAELATGYGLLGYSWRFAGELSLLAVAAVGIVWIAIDARLMVAVLTFFALIAVQMAVTESVFGGPILPVLPFPAVAGALMVATSWLLRRQSARVIRAD
jgi:hypothetical protein